MKHDDVFLKHILEETSFLLKEISPLSSRQLTDNEVSKRACARSLEIIGEAAKRLAKEQTDKYKRIPWRSIAGMRDFLIHDYGDVDFNAVWDIIKSDLPRLKDQMKEIIKKEGYE